MRFYTRSILPAVIFGAIACNAPIVQSLQQFSRAKVAQPSVVANSPYPNFRLSDSALDVDAETRAIAFSKPNGWIPMIYVTTPRGILTWRVVDGKLTYPDQLTDRSGKNVVFGDFYGELETSDNGQILAYGTNESIRILRLDDRKLLRVIPRHNRDLLPIGESSNHSNIAISSDGKTIISNESYEINVWRVSDGQLLRTIPRYQSFIVSLTISPDGKNIIAASTDKKIRVWRLNDGQLLRTINTGHQDKIESLVVSPDGQNIVSGSKDKSIKVWRFSDGKLLYTIVSGHPEGAERIVSNNNFIISAGRNSNTQVWRLSDGRLLQEISTGRLNSIALSPDGKTLFTGGDNAEGHVRVWRNVN